MLKYNIISNKTYSLNFNEVYFFMHRHTNMANKCDITKNKNWPNSLPFGLKIYQ
jgi:hypothetical protein